MFAQRGRSLLRYYATRGELRQLRVQPTHSADVLLHCASGYDTARGIGEPKASKRGTPLGALALIRLAAGQSQRDDTSANNGAQPSLP